jgi:hypothetical protein
MQSLLFHNFAEKKENKTTKNKRYRWGTQRDHTMSQQQFLSMLDYIGLLSETKV